MNSLLHKNNTASKPAVLHGKAKPVVQTKLTINEPGDIYEQEADAMADRVMRMSSTEPKKPVTGLIGSSLQRKCSHCEDEEKRRKPVMRKTENGFGGMLASSSLVSSLNASKGGGSPLPEGTKSFMENAFSTDFSVVRVHTGGHASHMSKGINAKAFTHGNDIYFNEGQYDPGSGGGKHLLAHELTHVLQQGKSIAPKIQRAGDLSKVPPMACDVAATSSGGTAAHSSLFPTSSTSLSEAERNDIATFVLSWQASGGTDILRVDGYASTSGTDEMNWQLSCDRALSVANELRNNGVPDTLIEIFAQGETSEFGVQGNNQRANISMEASVPVTPPVPVPAAECPPTYTIPDDVYTAIEDAWSKSGHGSDTVTEHGGRIVTDKDGKRVIRTGSGGGGSISLPAEQAGDTTAGTFHTHPYSQNEHSTIGVSFSGGDIENFVGGSQGSVKYIGAGTCDFILNTMDVSARDTCKTEDLPKRWNDAFGAAGGTFQEKVEIAVKATIAGCGLCYYKTCRPDETSPIPKDAQLA